LAEFWEEMFASAPSSWTATVARSCSNDSETGSSPGSPPGTTCAPSTAGPGPGAATSSPAGSHARTLAQLARAPESMGSDLASGGNLPGSFARWDPATSSWKTPQCSLFEGSAEYSGTWPRWGTMRNGVCWVRTMLAPLTSERGPGFWPTHLASECHGSLGLHRGDGRTKRSLTNLARFIPTPRAMDGSHGARTATPTVEWRVEHGKANLAEFVVQFPTPAARDWRGPNAKPYSERGGGAKGNQLPNAVGGMLNPPWVEWLMGWPIGWTACEPLATARFQQWLRSHSEF